MGRVPRSRSPVRYCSRRRSPPRRRRHSRSPPRRHRHSRSPPRRRRHSRSPPRRCRRSPPRRRRHSRSPRRSCSPPQQQCCCCICLDMPVSPVKLCGTCLDGVSCHECALKWARLNPSCPMCRGAFSNAIRQNLGMPLLPAREPRHAPEDPEPVPDPVPDPDPFGFNQINEILVEIGVWRG